MFCLCKMANPFAASKQHASSKPRGKTKNPAYAFDRRKHFAAWKDALCRKFPGKQFLIPERFGGRTRGGVSAPAGQKMRPPARSSPSITGAGRRPCGFFRQPLFYSAALRLLCAASCFGLPFRHCVYMRSGLKQPPGRRKCPPAVFFLGDVRLECGVPAKSNRAALDALTEYGRFLTGFA